MKIKIPFVVLAVNVLAWMGSPSNSRCATHSKHANGETGDTADISMFYDALKPYGAWYNTTLYGDVWHPTAADQKADWRPYTNGNWGQTDQGWTWLSDEPFGWAVYHYGRWTELKDTGWVWVPDSEWATAWVAWRSSSSLQMAEITAPDQVSYHDADSPAGTPAPGDSSAPAATPASKPVHKSSSPAPAVEGGGSPADSSAPPADTSGGATAGASVALNYIGWAPLPPEAVVSADADIGPSVDVSCSIDPSAYCFVAAADIGAPDLSLVIYPPDQDYLYVSRTVNVTNIAYYGPGGRSVYVGGPDFARARALSKQPIPSLQLDRQTNSRAVAKSLREGHGSEVHGNSLQIASPHFKGKPADGTLGHRASLPKADSVKAAPPKGADPAAVSRAHAAMARQAHATIPHAQAVQAVAASQAEGRAADRSPDAASSPGNERETREAGEGGSRSSSSKREEERGTSSRGGEEHSSRSSRGGEEKSASSRSGSEGRHHISSAASRGSHAAKPEGFMDSLKRQVSEAGRNIANGGQPEGRGGTGKGGARPAARAATTSVSKKK